MELLDGLDPIANLSPPEVQGTGRVGKGFQRVKVVANKKLYDFMVPQDVLFTDQ